MARRDRFTHTLSTEPGWTFTPLRSKGRALVGRITVPAAACAFLALGFLLLQGSAPGWAQSSEKPQPSQKQPSSQKQPPSVKTPPSGKPQASDKQQPPSPSSPPPNDKQQMQGLDEQIQEVKSDVLRITAELSQLEEKLLYPSGTQVAIFVALAKDDKMRLDSVQLKIDGQLAAHYLYSFKELEALRKGGVQRVYVGNVATGDHQLEVLVDGKVDGGSDFSRTDHFTFRKEVKPKLVSLTLASPNSGGTPIALGEW